MDMMISNGANNSQPNISCVNPKFCLEKMMETIKGIGGGEADATLQ